MKVLYLDLDLIIYILGFVLSTDFLISGIFASIYKNINHMPRGVGYLFFKVFMNGMNKYKGTSKITLEIFSFRALCFYSILGGTIYTILGLYMIFSKIFVK